MSLDTSAKIDSLFPSSILKVFKVALIIYSRNFLVVSTLVSVVIALLALPLYLVFSASTNPYHIVYFINIFESLFAVIINSLIILLLPHFINSGELNIKAVIGYYLKFCFSKVMLMAVIVAILIFLISEFLPILAFVGSFLLLLTPFFYFYNLEASIITVLTTGARIAIDNFAKLLGLMLLLSMVSLAILLILAMVFLLINDSATISVLDAFGSTDEKEIGRVLFNYFSSSSFLIAYMIMQLFYQPLKALVLSFLFISFTKTKYADFLHKYLLNFSQLGKD